MINVPGNYTPYADKRYIQTEATFELIDVDAAEQAEVTTSAELPFSKKNQTIDKTVHMSQKVATAELGEWVLNGTYAPVSLVGDNEEVGYWSEALSDLSGNIDVTLTFEFSASVSSKAITVIFDDATGNCGENFILKAYDSNNTLINSTTITGNNSSVVIVDMTAENYKKIVLNITKTNKPYRHVRVCEVLFGYLKIFTDDDIVSAIFEYDSSIYSESFPSNKMTLTIDNTDRRYNIINPAGIYKFLQKGQGLNGSVVINNSRIIMGRFYFNSSSSDDNSMTVKIIAYDKAYSLDNIPCTIGQSGSWTMNEAVAAVISNSGLNIVTAIPEAIGVRVVGKAFPNNASCREALRLIAQAAMCVCYFNRFDELEFREQGIETFVDSLNNDNMSSYPGITDTGLINSIIITAKDEYSKTENTYTAQDVGEGEEKKVLNINNPLVLSNDVAQWVLSRTKYRIRYAVSEQGNPARELQDVINIADVYGENKNGLVIKETFTSSIGLIGSIEAVTKFE